jgi:broad specificity phosphatase PhoE
VLILVRHGQTAVNAGGRLQGRIDAPLTELGRAQAAATAAAVTAVRPGSRIVTSPLRRARDTAAAFGGDATVDERWIELDYGDWDGVPLGDVPPAQWAAWRSDPEFAPPGGESMVDLGRRVREACEALLAAAAETDVVVVSHVSPIKAAVAWALGVGDAVAWRLHLDVASICRIAVRPAGPVLVAFNEVAHLAQIRSEG